MKEKILIFAMLIGMGIPAIAQKTSDQMLHENRMQNMRDEANRRFREAENRNKQGSSSGSPSSYGTSYEDEAKKRYEERNRKEAEANSKRLTEYYRNVAKWRHKYQAVTEYPSLGFIFVKQNNKWGAKGEHEQNVIPVIYTEIAAYTMQYHYPDKTAARKEVKTLHVKSGNQWGVYRLGTGEIVPPRFNEVDTEYFGKYGLRYIGVKLNSNHKWSVYDTHAKKEISPPKYDKIIGMKDCAAVQVDGKWGFVDSEGKEIIPLMYEDVKSGVNIPISLDDPLPVKLKGKWGYINQLNKMVIPFKKYEWITAFQSGRATVKMKDKWAYEIDNAGKRIGPK